ncbi:TPM domain-containing protein [Haloferula rosea]|uniref:TPM domain-containing protein n=1 Tax=Haloferula rosea TaxID=490093 RepID=A0A934RDB8_9BACT|nr:TPM domain-containing protein [Haloferula rosea]MBK1828638.1 hypothetical protein [Haloferula rosea]
MKLWLSLLTILWLPLMAQQSFELPVPPRPANRVLDQARLFAVEPERRQALEAKLAEFTGRTGYQVEVALFDNLIGVELPEQSEMIKDEWLGDAPGLVLVVVTDSGDWRIAWASTPDVVTESGTVPVLDEHDVAPQTRVEVVNTLRALPRMETGSLDGVGRLVDALLSSLESSFTPDERPRAQRLRVWVLGIGALAGVVLLALMAVTLSRRGDAKRRDQWVFPDVPVGQRLGAAAGGGKISSRTFSQGARANAGDEASEA